MGSGISLHSAKTLTSFEDLREFILSTKQNMSLVFETFTIQVLGTDNIWVTLTSNSKFLFNLMRFIWKYPVFFRIEFTPRSDQLGFPMHSPTTVLLTIRSFCRLSNHLDLLSHILTTGSAFGTSSYLHLDSDGQRVQQKGENEEKNEEEEKKGNGDVDKDLNEKNAHSSQLMLLSIQSEEECNICMERPCDLVLSCSHTMCSQCFEELREQ